MVNGEFQGVSNCGGCAQNLVGTKFITFDGQGTSGIMLLGESPWLDEVRYGKPFAGAAGSLLDSQLKRAGLDRKSVIISNVMWCNPPYLGWVGKHPDSAVALRNCQPYWHRLVEVMKPKVIVTMGEVALEQVLSVHGLDNRQSYIHDSSFGIPVVPTYHPAFIQRGNQKLTQAFFFAIAKAKEIAVAAQWQRQPVSYLVDPPVEKAREYLFGAGAAQRAVSLPSKLAPEALRSPGALREVSEGSSNQQWRTLPAPDKHWQIPLLVCDIETPNSSSLNEEEREDKDPSYTIIRMSFSVAPTTAISIPYSEPYIGLAKEAMAQAAVVVFWNGDGFDIPRLNYNGVRWSGEVHDGMWMWHFLQSDMLKGLGFVAPFFTDLPAWKHLSSSDLGYYSACDADAEMRCYLAIREQLVKSGRWERFVRHCIRMNEIFRQPDVGKLHINKQAQVELEARLMRERDMVLELIQGEVPSSIKPKKVYKKQPKDSQLSEGEWQVTQTPCSCQLLQTNDLKVELP